MLYLFIYLFILVMIQYYSWLEQLHGGSLDPKG